MPRRSRWRRVEKVRRTFSAAVALEEAHEGGAGDSGEVCSRSDTWGQGGGGFDSEPALTSDRLAAEARQGLHEPLHLQMTLICGESRVEGGVEGGESSTGQKRKESRQKHDTIQVSERETRHSKGRSFTNTGEAEQGGVGGDEREEE